MREIRDQSSERGDYQGRFPGRPLGGRASSGMDKSLEGVVGAVNMDSLVGSWPDWIEDYV